MSTVGGGGNLRRWGVYRAGDRKPSLPRRVALVGTEPAGGSPAGSDGQESRDLGSTPGWGRSPGGGHGNLLQYSRREHPTERGAWRDYSPRGRRESDYDSAASTLFHFCPVMPPPLPSRGSVVTSRWELQKRLYLHNTAAGPPQRSHVGVREASVCTPNLPPPPYHHQPLGALPKLSPVPVSWTGQAAPSPATRRRMADS